MDYISRNSKNDNKMCYKPALFDQRGPARGSCETWNKGNEAFFRLKTGQDIVLHSPDEEHSSLPRYSSSQSRPAELETNLNEADTDADLSFARKKTAIQKKH